MIRYRNLAAALALALAAGLAGCGSDTKTATTTTVRRQTTTTARQDTTTTGGGMHAGAPQFTAFSATSPVPCKDGNATVTMAFTTINVVSIEIKIGDGKFAGTAGYNPNETAAVASIPCSGAGQSAITLRGCTEDNECAASETKAITIS